MNNLDNLAINALRVVSTSMISKAKSGHPGICLGSAPILHTLFTRHLLIDSSKGNWPNRDRFVLSAGHGSAILYVLLHLSGFDISVSDLQQFRQKDSKTAGHPEYGHTPGVEVTTGPLGQGLATAVGMAISGKYFNAKFNKSDCKLFNYNTYVLCGDGDLQEGLAMEACSLAGHLALNNLIVLYDSNDIQLDGPTSNSCDDNIKMKFEAMNWNYLRVDDGFDVLAIDEAIKKAKENKKPTIIEVKTIIGYGTSLAGTSSIHGKPLNDEQLASLKDNLDYHYDNFTIPNEVYELYKKAVIVRGKEARLAYEEKLKSYSEKYNADYLLLNQILNKKIDIPSDLPTFTNQISTRKVAGSIITKMAEANQSIMAGSADLVNSTMIKGVDGNFSKENYQGRNICYGVREHAMASICNGLTLSNLVSVVAGFFVFSDYMKDSIREAALMSIPSLFIFSHDSVCVGEDGPTHQPVEQLAGLRAMPNLNVVRPADAKEMTYAIIAALKGNNYPTVIVSSRQDVPVLAETNEDFNKGAYIVYEPQKIDYILLSCGTELNLCLNVAKELAKQDIGIRVVSMPSMFIFNKQSEEYKNKILPNRAKTLAIELGASMPWYRYANQVLGVDEFGKSMPLSAIYSYFGFTLDNITARLKSM